MKLLLAILIQFSLAKVHNSFAPDYSDRFILKISWKDKTHGQVNMFWLLEKCDKEISEFEKLVFDSSQMKVTPIIVPRYPEEYLFCCEKNNTNYVSSENFKKLVDSLSPKYEHQFNKLYLPRENIKLKSSKAFLVTQDTLNTKFEIRLFKIKMDICKCKAANNNPGSTYSDTIVNINKILKYVNVSNDEQTAFMKNIGAIFSIKMIKERLPLK